MNVSGSFQPVFFRAVRSVFSRSMTRPPFSSSTYDMGGLSTREQVVTMNRRDGDRYDWWFAPRQCSSWCSEAGVARVEQGQVGTVEPDQQYV